MNTREVALGGVVSLHQAGFSPFLSRAVFSVEIAGDLWVQDGDQPLKGFVRPDGDDFSYRVDGQFEHVNSSNEKTWRYALRFPAFLRCPAGERLQVRVAFRKPIRRLIETEQQGEWIASTTMGLAKQEAWIEIVSDEGAIRYESDGDELLTFIANHADVRDSAPDKDDDDG